MLSDGEKRRLVVSRGIDRGNAVSACREAFGDLDGQLLSIHALEEGKLGRVKSRSVLETGDGLDNKVRMANDVSALKLLRSGVVIGIGVDKVSGYQIFDVHTNSKRCISLDSRKIGCKLGQQYKKHSQLFTYQVGKTWMTPCWSLRVYRP